MATIETAQTKYKNKILAARTSRKYVKGLARFFGVTPDAIASAEPVKNWDTFDVDTAAKNWIDNLKAAFGLK